MSEEGLGHLYGNPKGPTRHIAGLRGGPIGPHDGLKVAPRCFQDGLHWGLRHCHEMVPREPT
eukprot:9504116-Pyramimonas_sp.AAC.2